MSNLWHWLGKLGLIGTIVIVSSLECVEAQITPDSTLPNNSNVRLEGNTRIISGGTTRGANLFHSFSEFSIKSGETALFNNTLDIQNIISRVTGKSISNIDGLIKSNGTANVFLMNPNGIIFGKNASLNIGGSFAATTANAIGFGNLGFFSASNPQAPSPLLTINPNALLFNQIAAAPIQNNSVALLAEKDPAGFDVYGLRVSNGKSLLLVGGNINMDGGQLNAYGGRVELGGLAASGNVGLNVDGDKLSLDFPASSTRADVSLTNGAAAYVEAGGGGSIAVNARNLEVSGGSELSAGIGQGLGNAGAKAGDITLNATGDVKLDGSDIFNNVRSQATGNAGDINITTGSLNVSQSEISASTSGIGNAGNLKIHASDSVELSGEILGTDGQSVSPGGLLAQVNQNGVGHGGNLTIETKSLSVSDGSKVQVATFGQGDAGYLLIRASDVNVFNTTKSSYFSTGIFAGNEYDNRLVTPAKGNGGNLTIETERLNITNGGQVTSDTNGIGNAGQVLIQATDSVNVIGKSPNGGNSSSLSTTVENRATGKGGDLIIKTGSLNVSDNGNVSANTYGTGNAGNLTIEARNVNVRQSQVSASTFNKGDAGILTVKASESIELSGVNFGVNDQFPAGLLAQVDLEGSGRGGQLNIETRRLSISNGAKVQVATFGTGDAGNLFIRANDIDIFETTQPRYAYYPTGIVAGVQTTRSSEKPPKGNGGNATIETNRLTVRDGGVVTTTTQGQGNAGTLRIHATDSVEVFGTAPGAEFRDSSEPINSEISAATTSSSTGNAGSLSIVTGKLIIRDRGMVTVRNEGKDGTSQAGNLEINAREVNLDKGIITATTNSGNGGNITLTLKDLLLLRNNSTISTTAGTAQLGGNGGNITINAPLGFIVAIPNENSDITANAFSGQGGRVNIDTQSNFFIAPLSRSELESRLMQIAPGLPLVPSLLPTNDITAISQANPSPNLNGQVTINTPDIDPSRGLVQLPINLFDAQKQISTACTPGTRQFQNTFVVTGRGGLPISPTELLQDSSTLSAWVRLKTQPENSVNTTTQSQAAAISNHTKVAAVTTPIVAATGWVVARNGNILLVAQVPSVNPQIPWQTPTTCPISQQ